MCIRDRYRTRRRQGVIPCLLFYSIIHELPQFWHKQTFSFVITVFSPPLDFFHTRFDIPSVQAAVNPLAMLFMCPPKPFPCFLVLVDACWIETVTLSLPHFGQNIFVPFSFPKVITFYAAIQWKTISDTNNQHFALFRRPKTGCFDKENWWKWKHANIVVKLS